MEQTGIVIETKEKTAKVKVVRGTACGENCGSCHLCENRDSIRWMINDAGARKGDTVLIEMKSSRVILMAFVAYIVPLIIGTAAYLVLSVAFGKGVIAELTSFIIMAVSIFLVAKFNTFNKEKYQSHVTEILEKEADNEQN